MIQIGIKAIFQFMTTKLNGKMEKDMQIVELLNF